MSIFKDIKGGHTLELQVKVVLQRWLPTYLAEVERQHDLDAGTLPRPRSWKRTNEFNKWPEDQIPAIIIISPGLVGKPIRHGKQYHGKFALAVAALVSGREPGVARDVAGLYTAAIRACLLQRRSLEGFARGTDWVQERYDDIRSTESRNLASGQCVFEVELENVVSWGVGPITPSEPPIDPNVPFEDWPLVTDGGATVNNNQEVQP